MALKGLIHSTIIFTIFIILFYSCTENPDDPLSASLSVIIGGSEKSDTTFLTFNNSKDAVLLIIKSGEPWTANTDNPWLSLAAHSGEKGSTGIVIGAAENKSFPRNGEISITSGKNTHLIIANQNGAPALDVTLSGVTFKMILVEGGSFILGDNNLYGSTPEYEVTLNSYYICEKEVTNELWKAVLNYLPYDNIEEYAGHTESEKPKHPLSAATYNEITSVFLPVIKKITGFDFRLPTEAEWEYAAMGGKYSNDFVYSGSNMLDEAGWDGYNSDNEKKETGKKLPNELGLYDMSGNVAEWCSDWFSYYYSLEDNNNPSGPETGTEKVIRGGDFTSTAIVNTGPCAVKYRSSLIPGCYNGCWGDTGHPEEPVCFRCKTVGFRMVIGLTE